MNRFYCFIGVWSLLLLSTICHANCGSQNDTIYICQGQSVQLETSPNDAAYLWTPNQNIDNPTIYNPIVSPTQTTTYYVEVTPPTDFNFVVNGDFEQGNFGFQSDYIFTNTTTFAQGHYGIFTNPQQMNVGFSPCTDHSPTGSGLMMVVDGAVILDENVWCQTISVNKERTYDFSAWIANIHPTEPSILQFSINGELLGNPLDVDQVVCEWEEFSAQWYADCNSTATICITNQSTVAFGNDFAIDDISFTFSEATYQDTFTVVVLENSLSTIDTIACENGTFFFDGEQVPAGTQKDFVYTAYNGCDSVIAVNVGLIDTFYFETTIDTLCPGDTILFQGQTITKDTSICTIYQTILGCDSTFCFVAYFLSEATIEIVANPPTCDDADDGTLFADPFAGLPPYQYLWSTGATAPMIEDLAPGVYQLTLTDSKNCLAEKTIVLEAPPPLLINAELTEPTCHGQANGTMELVLSGGTPEYTMFWQGDQTDVLFFDSLEAGTFAIDLEDSNGCRADTLLILGQPNPIVVSTVSDTSVVLGSSVDLNTTILSDFPYSVVWLPFVGLDCSDCESPLATPVDSRSYQILVEDIQGCVGETEVQIDVLKNYEVYIPSAFSPNDDGANDYLQVYTGPDVASIERFTIFNRWGGVMMEEKNCNPEDLSCSWDGFYQNDRVEQGIYVYIVEVRFIDEEVRTFSGDVLLLR